MCTNWKPSRIIWVRSFLIIVARPVMLLLVLTQTSMLLFCLGASWPASCVLFLGPSDSGAPTMEAAAAAAAGDAAAAAAAAARTDLCSWHMLLAFYDFFFSYKCLLDDRRKHEPFAGRFFVMHSLAITIFSSAWFCISKLFYCAQKGEFSLKTSALQLRFSTKSFLRGINFSRES